MGNVREAASGARDGRQCVPVAHCAQSPLADPHAVPHRGSLFFLYSILSALCVCVCVCGMCEDVCVDNPS
jgi:hypothetical protein